MSTVKDLSNKDEFETNADTEIKAVGLQASAYHLPMILGLARIFKKRNGAKIYIYVNSPEEKRGLEKRLSADSVDEVILSQHINTALSDPIGSESEIFDRARAWEDRIQETFGRLIFEHRPMARGYFTGAHANPRTPLVEKASHAQSVNGVVRTLDFWEREIKERGLSLIIEGDKCAVAVCRWLDVPYRRVFLSKFDGEHFWACDEKLTNPMFEHYYRSITEWPDVELSVTQPSQVYKVKKGVAKFQLRWAFATLARNVIKNVLLMTFGSHQGRYRISELFTTPFVARSNFIRYNKFVDVTLEELRGRKFVYFPLHKEPETNMLSASPDFFNQLSAITSIARDLPAGVPLVLKEHVPAFALRGPYFYRDLRDLKNVKIIDSLESSIEIIKEATATVTISGSAGLEASVIGRPSIQFGRFMINRFLPHVMTVEDDRDIAKFLHKAIEGEIDLDQARIDGARFRECLRRASFTMGEFMVEDQEFSEGSAMSAYTALLASLTKLPNVGAVAPNYHTSNGTV